MVASSGRAGSTMLTKALAASYVDSLPIGGLGRVSRLLERASCQYTTRLSNLGWLDAKIVKTHDLYTDVPEVNASFIFVYGDPLESAYSVVEQGEIYGQSWVRKHIKHLCSDGEPNQILSRDILNYEAQLVEWSRVQQAFVVHYDDLWTCADQLAEHVGFHVKLPERRPRSKKTFLAGHNEALFKRLKELEKGLRSSRHGRA